MSAASRILLVDDDPHLCALVTHMLAQHPFELECVNRGEEALSQLESRRPDAMLLDLDLPDMPGDEVLRRVLEMHPALPVVVLTAERDAQRVVSCVRSGASDYVVKPCEEVRLVTSLQNALEQGRLRRELRDLSAELRGEDAFARLLGRSRALRDSVAMLERAAQNGVTLLLEGESGTGKEVAARAVHDAGPRAAAPFVAVNCGALPEALVESELFGHEQGAFTGATERRVGCFEEANGGTLFLDEVGELQPDLQVKLLRALQEGKVRPVGSSREHAVDVRVIAATNRDLRSEVAAQRFRADLYYRLAVFPVELPALREREDDVIVLAQRFLERFALQYGRPARSLGARAHAVLINYKWPGNVRELENAIERAVILEDGVELSLESLPVELVQDADPGSSLSAPSVGGEPQLAASAEAQAHALSFPGPSDEILPLTEWERRLIEHALGVTRGNVREAAKRLGIGRTTMYRKMERYGLEAPRPRRAS